MNPDYAVLILHKTEFKHVIVTVQVQITSFQLYKQLNSEYRILTFRQLSSDNGVLNVTE